ncbi:uncharacterized protein LOC112680398 [Sipha flava]|uniref:Uncharacterized protein LOC112680398 n=1 Tax=Sipha flava TaxID=143950 RepID=A0A8B8F6A5_9HEMI|nr:uncharacterized protein LOC112680398 [Sipha flava]
MWSNEKQDWKTETWLGLQELRWNDKGTLDLQDPTIFYGEFLGYFNAKLGTENIFRATIGNHSMHDITSENGLRLIDFASGGGLFVKSTMFPRKDIYKGTWKAPNVRGADCDSDHYLVKGKLNVKLKKLAVKKGAIVNSYKTIKETLKVVTDTTIGKQKKSEETWFNTSCEETLNRRKDARLQWINDPSNREKESTYKERQKDANNIFRFEKRKFTKDILWEAETNHRVNKNRELHQKINSIWTGYKKHE